MYFGDRIPVAYEFQRGDWIVTVKLGREHFVPSFAISSNRPLNDVDAGKCADVFRKTDQIEVYWNYWRAPSSSCLREGDPVELVIYTSAEVGPMVLGGTVEESGRFLYFDGL